MDLRMPVTGGREAIRRIRGTAGGGEPKAIAVAASAMDENRQELTEIGADDCISKPFREADLFQKSHTRTGGEVRLRRAARGGAAREDAVELSRESMEGWPRDLTDPMREAVVTADPDLLPAKTPEVEGRDPRIAHGLRPCGTVCISGVP
jgi:CheY-like chemotaxis protein